MAYMSFKILGVDDYDMVYTKKGKVGSFRKGLNLSSLGDDEHIILKSYSKDEMAHMMPSDDLEGDFFYTHLPIVQDLKVLTSFIMFEFEVLKHINITPSQMTHNGQAFTKEFEILCRNLEVSPTVGLFLSFYNTKTAIKGSWGILGALSERVLLCPYFNNYENWKDRFVRVRGRDDQFMTIFDKNTEK